MKVISRNGSSVTNVYVDKTFGDSGGTVVNGGGLGTSVQAPDPIKLWDRIGENYKRVLKK